MYGIEFPFKLDTHKAAFKNTSNLRGENVEIIVT